ncbi:transcription initiation factor IIB family protein [Halorubrum sp. JWXQ-INN 858]|uniref:transcription initiation factor IIB family protein n=1 Tax=Halorubrum sp. JWXQ-INN 858 TaxID=2690782 RepID=UPI001358E494|nr:transcription initiation factor IIB family protein [Halorubrum sp. JWXQ-INN 858]MWV63360.1 transcription initiation factor IIB family protein [Halorubrum sp. JWXQ-INN 858]
MYRASDRVDNEEWVARIESACADLDLDGEACATATDLFLSGVPETDRSKPATAAASLYAAALIRGQERSQSAVADAMGVSRLSVQQGWKPILEEAGFSPPTW